jgi:hypothetical protein
MNDPISWHLQHLLESEKHGELRMESISIEDNSEIVYNNKNEPSGLVNRKRTITVDVLYLD